MQAMRVTWQLHVSGYHDEEVAVALGADAEDFGGIASTIVLCYCGYCCTCHKESADKEVT